MDILRSGRLRTGGCIRFSRYLIRALLMAAAVCLSAACVRAEVKVTIRNNRNHNLSLAFCWANMDDYQTKGWYAVKAGETRTITIKDAMYAFTAKEFGFYAQGGGTTWRGKAEDNRCFWINSKSAFDIRQERDEERPHKQADRVFFRPLRLSGDAENGNATLNFNP